MAFRLITHYITKTLQDPFTVCPGVLETVFPKTGSACRSELTSVLLLTGAHVDEGTEQALPHRKDQQLSPG